MTLAAATDDLEDVGPWGQAVAISFRFLLFGAIAIAIGWLCSNISQVPPESQAVVTRFGAVARVVEPGLLIAWPRPIERINIIPGRALQMPLPLTRLLDGDDQEYAPDVGYVLSNDQRLNSSFVLTGDMSVVHVTGQLFFHITDAGSYVVSRQNIETSLQRIAIAAIVEIVSKRSLDTIIVARPERAAAAASGRETLRSDVVQAINARVQALADLGTDLGVRVSRIDLLPGISQGAKAAFDTVLKVSQDAEAEIAAARTAADKSLQEAAQAKDRTLTDATARAEETVTGAISATASIALLAQSNDAAAALQRTRIYYERIGPILRRAGRVYTVGDGKGRLIVPGGHK